MTHYWVYLNLSEDEAVALARLGKIAFRDIRTEAHYQLRQRLIDMGMLPEEHAETVDETSD
jgi:Fe2+ transport system protein FeoA